MSGPSAGSLLRRALAASTALTGITLRAVSPRQGGGWALAGGSALALCGFGGMTAPAHAQVTTTGSTYRDTGGNAFIGYTANGSVTVAGGSSLSSTTTTLGLPSGARGTLSVDGQGSSATNAGTVTVGAAGIGVLTLSNGGLVQAGSGAGTITLARDAGSTGTLNIGAASGSSAVAAGSVQAGSVVFGAGTGALVFNHTGDPNGAAVTFAPAITGTGSVSNLAGTTILTGANTFGGTTTISGGTLVAVSSAALGTADGTAANGTTLSGTGTLALQGGVAIGNEALTFNGVYLGNSNVGGTLRSVSGANSYAGPLTLNAWESNVTVDAGSTLALTGPITALSTGNTLNLDGAGNGTVTGRLNLLPSTSGFLSGGVKKTGTGTWTMTGDGVAYSAYVGSGTLAFQGGRTFTNQFTLIGSSSSPGAPATLAVSGAGTTWDTGQYGYLDVGFSAPGFLTVSDGATVKSRTVYIGRAVGGGNVAEGPGTVTVTGTNSSLDAGYLGVGALAHGTLTVTQGGRVTSRGSIVGDYSGVTGTVTVTGAHSTWTDTSSLTVGNYGRGTVSVTAGGTLASQVAYLGANSGVTGAVAVSGAGSTWTNNSTVYVGVSGIGTATVADGGTVTSQDTRLGSNAGSSGTVTVTGAGSAWTDTSSLTVGFGGTGTLTVAQGGAVSVGPGGTGTLTLAQNTGSTGTLIVGAAAGSPAVAAGSVQAGTLAFGAGTGALVFNHTGDPNGAAITFAPAITGTGTVSNLSGTTILTGANTYGGGTTISGGTLVAASNTALGAADGTAVNSTTVAAGATLRLSGGVAIGNEALSINGYGANGTDGALHSIAGANSFAGAITATGDSRISVDAGSTLALTGPITGNSLLALGGAGDGTATGNITGFNVLNKTDSGTWTLTGQNAVTYSFFDSGTVRIQSGGTLTDESGVVGSNSNATVIVAGPGSAWINTTDAAVGVNGAGAVTVTDGGAMVVGARGDGKLYLSGGSASATGVLNVGAALGDAPASAGIVTAGEVTTDGGTGTVVFNHTGYRDGSDVTFTPTITGANSLVQAAGTTILTGANTYTGTTTIQGGTLVAASSTALGAANGTAATGTTLTGGGTLALQGGIAVGNEALALNGGTLRSVSGANSYAGPITVKKDSSVTVDAGSTLALTGAIYGPVLPLPPLTGPYLPIVTDTLTLSGAGNGTSTGGIRLTYDLAKTGPGTWTLTGGNSAFSVSVGSGTLALQGGGNFSSNVTDVGTGGSADGTATLAVSGAGTHWGSVVYVGKSSAGRLIVSDGASVSGFGSQVGVGGGVSGSVTVTGPNSNWNSGSYLMVGVSGPGTIDVINGGSLTSYSNYIGYGATGTVTVSGANSTWTGNNDLQLGLYGGVSGTIAVADGGTLGSRIAYLGVAAGSSGTVTVTGVKSTWTNSASLSIGFVGTGTLTVADGGRVTTTDTGLGTYGTASSGTVTVTGANSAWSNGGTLAIGASGTGTVTVANGGALTSTSASLGNAHGASGTVTVTGANSAWSNGGALNVGVSGTGTLTVAEGGTVSVGSGGAGTLTLAQNIGSTGTLNIGATAGAAPAAPGTVQAAAVTAGDGTGTLVFNHTGAAYTFAPAITGSARVTQLSGTTILTNTSTYTGPTTVAGGTLQVDGTLTSTDVTVASGGTLAGSGKIGDPLIQAGGTLAPGSASAIGTLSIYGPLTFEPGSFYRVRVGGNANDRTDVAGPVTLNGGTVQATMGAGTVLPGQRYTIIAAPGGVTGTFTALQTNRSFLFLAPTLFYDATHVILGIAQVAPFTSVATTRNQFTTALALGGVPFGDGTGPASPAAQAALALVNQETVAGARQALTALSGEVQGSAVSARVQTAFTEQAAILDHLRFGAGTGPAGGASLAGSVGQRFAAGTTLPAAYAALPRQRAGGEPGRVTLPPEARGIDVWGSAFGSFGSADSTRNTARLSRDTGGFVLGAETGALGEAVGRAGSGLHDWRVGVAAGYSFTQFDITGRASSGQIESGFGSLYARGPVGPLQVRLGGIYAGDAYDARRAVAFPGVSQVANGRSGGDTLQGFGEVGYRIGGAQGYLEPFVGGAALRIRRDGFTETGGFTALTSFGRSYDIQTVSTGVQGQLVLADLWGGAGPLLARGLVGARFAFGDVTPAALLAFRGGGGAFPILGAPVATAAALVSAGLDWQVAPDTQIGLGYEGQLGNRAQDNAIKGNVSYRW